MSDRRPPAVAAAPVSPSDEEVVARVLAGETAQFEILMCRYNQRLFRAVRAITRVDADAEDAVQQAFLAAYVSLGQFAGAAAFSTWLTRIAIREATARLSRRRRLAEVAQAAEDEARALADQARSPEEDAAGRELGGILEAAIDALPEAYRVVYVLREVQQLSVAETAACLDISTENVKIRLHRAKARLRAELHGRVAGAPSDTFVFLGARCDRLVAAVLARIVAHRAAAGGGVGRK